MDISTIIQMHNQKSMSLMHLFVKNHKKIIKLHSTYNLFDSEFVKSEVIQNAFILNQEITKIGSNHMPYWIHAVRVALLVHDLIYEAEKEKIRLLAAALLHDYIEEGNASPDEMYHKLLLAFSNDMFYAQSACLLTEPRVDCIDYSSDDKDYCVLKMAMIHQVVESKYPLLINVLVCDFLDSVICCLYNNFDYRNIHIIASLLKYISMQFEGIVYLELRKFIVALLDSKKSIYSLHELGCLCYFIGIIFLISIPYKVAR